jgi:hypothetical protein
MKELNLYQIGFALNPSVFRRNMLHWDKELCYAALRRAYREFDLSKYVDVQSVAPPESEDDISVVDAGNEQAERSNGARPFKRRRLEDFEGDSEVSTDIAEIERYLKEPLISLDMSVLEWWKLHQTIYPKLAAMARVYLALPCSSAASERVFSTARLQLDYKRRRLDPERVSRIVCMNRNIELYIRLTQGDEAWDMQVNWWGRSGNKSVIEV